MDKVKVKAKSKSKKKSKENKVWPAQAVKIESVVNRAAVHKAPVAPAAARVLRRVPPTQTHMLFGARTVVRKW